MDSDSKKIWIIGEQGNYLLDAQYIVAIGSNSSAAFRIGNTHGIASHHARFSRKCQSWSIEPIDGQFLLNGEEIEDREKIAIGDEIQIGDCFFIVQEENKSSPLPTPSPPISKPSAVSSNVKYILLNFLSKLKQKLPKPILFGIFGAIGCFLAAILLGEILLNLTKLPPPPQPSARAVVLLIDCSGSMDGGKLQEVKLAAQSFVQRQVLTENRIAVVGFGSHVHPAANLTGDKTTLTQAIASLVDGGGTSMENGIQTATQKLQSKAFKRNILLFTDGLPDNKVATTIVAQSVRNQGINIVAVATGDADINYLAQVTGNPRQVIYASSGQFEQAFEQAQQVIDSLVENNLTGNYNPVYLILRIGAWTGLLAIGTSLALVIGQNFYSQRHLLTFKEGNISIIGGFAAGFTAGSIGQLLSLSATNINILYAFNAVRSIFGWVIVGTLLGVGASFLTLNLQLNKGLLRGAIGGVIASICYLITNYIFSNIVIGMLIGVIVLGFFIRSIAPQIRFGCVTSFVVGIVAITISEIFLLPIDFLNSIETISRIGGWALLGILLGGGMSLFIPNLELRRALFGGGIGGLIAAASFLAVSGLLNNDFTGRIVSAAILGFFIGLMIALVEAFSRDISLIVQWTPTEKSAFSLGAKPVILGSSEESHIYLSKDKGFPPLTAKIYIDGEKIIMQYHEAMREKGISQLRHELKCGDRQKVGDIVIEAKKLR
jgi:Ca-activated chloride channel homolog